MSTDWVPAESSEEESSLPLPYLQIVDTQPGCSLAASFVPVSAFPFNQHSPLLRVSVQISAFYKNTILEWDIP